MGEWVLAVLALLTGVLVPTQSAVNGVLGRSANGPLFAGLITVAVGTLTLTLTVVCCRAAGLVQVPAGAELTRAPWWAWVGGVLGGTFVVSTASLAPRLGTATMVAFLVCGQFAASALLDHFGLLGLARRPATVPRLAGLALIAAGVALVWWSGRNAEGR